ncbi:unnamed protein product [Rotaria sp. Silwood1]|nr:unnamed protein product [Rotaria sp. Silwood1]
MISNTFRKYEDSNDHHKLEQVRSSPKFENLFINIEYDQIKLCDFGDSICLSNMKYVRRMSGNIPIYYKTDICNPPSASECLMDEEKF